MLSFVKISLYWKSCLLSKRWCVVTVFILRPFSQLLEMGYSIVEFKLISLSYITKPPLVGVGPSRCASGVGCAAESVANAVLLNESQHIQLNTNSSTIHKLITVAYVYGKESIVVAGGHAVPWINGWRMSSLLGTVIQSTGMMKRRGEDETGLRRKNGNLSLLPC